MSYFVEQIRTEIGDIAHQIVKRDRWQGDKPSKAAFCALAREMLKVYYLEDGTPKPHHHGDLPAPDVVRLLDLDEREIYRYTHYDLNVDTEIHD